MYFPQCKRFDTGIDSLFAVSVLFGWADAGFERIPGATDCVVSSSALSETDWLAFTTYMEIQFGFLSLCKLDRN